MLEYHYDAVKSALLERERGIGFPAIVRLIQEGRILDSYDHPNAERYPGQKIYAIDVAGYVYLVPYVRSEESIFLKTIFPSRKATRHYLRTFEDKDF